MAEEGSQSSNKRHSGRMLRQATLILPSTGERVKRDFTLRDPRFFGTPNVNSNGNATNSANNNEQTPLLGGNKPVTKPRWTQRIKKFCIDSARQTWEFSKSPTGKNVFKCSLAYLLATLCTFAEPVANSLSTHQDGNQLVANIVVWFDPARSAGSMEKGVLLSFLGFLYAVLVGYGSMGTSAFFSAYSLAVVGHVIALIVFVGFALGFIGWLKQHLSDPLVNVTCSLASLAIVSVLTRERAVQEGVVQSYRITQILKMLVVGIIISTVVNLVVWPVAASRRLRESLTETTNTFSDLITILTASFLSGSQADLDNPAVTAASDRFQTVFNSLPNHLRESRYEKFFLGKERQFRIEKRLVNILQRLAQDMGGLRSAARTQVALLAEAAGDGGSTGMQTPRRVFSIDQYMDSQPILASMVASPERHNLMQDPLIPPVDRGDLPPLTRTTTGTATASDIFETFITQLGPPMKSLAYTLKQILQELPYGPGPEFSITNHPKFRSSLNEAIKLFNGSRKAALELVYKSKELSEANSVHVAADFEEVAASCGHFASSLEDFAEHCLMYLDILDELQLEVDERPSGFTWNWLLFWRKRISGGQDDQEPIYRDTNEPESMVANNNNTPQQKQKQSKNPAWNEKPSSSFGFPYSLWPYLRFIRREDIRFAIKTGGGATFIAMFSFIPATEALYMQWHLEWALVSYMLVCNMTIGASNTTGWARFLGTLYGAGWAIVVWLASQENPYLLAFFGWIVSLACFYIIVAQGDGPKGRYILLTYNLSVLYSYSLSVIEDPDADPDEREANDEIYLVVLHRVIAVLLGATLGLIVTRWIWPISARKKLHKGMSLLWLRMGLMWKRPPLSLLTETIHDRPYYMDIREENDLREFLETLQSLRKNADAEFELRGPFPGKSYDVLLQSSSNMLDNFHALNVVMQKDLKASAGEAVILKVTTEERDELAKRISHLFAVLASSARLEYPLNDTLPRVEHPRDRLLAKIFAFRKDPQKPIVPTEEDYELLYAYALVTGQVAKEIETSGKEIEKLFGALSEEVLKLQ